MASMSLTTSLSPPWLTKRSTQYSRSTSASLTLQTGRSSVSVNVASKSLTSRSGLLHCSFVSYSLNSLAFCSSFSGLSLGLDFNSNIGVRKQKGRSLVVRAGKAALCLTKRNRSRKSLARTHGFRRRMRTTSGRAILKRRRAKGRWVLCPKSNPNSGKRA
ncbi:50S ribosomal protein L34, chloroplastic-like [Melia azedarach]|uniref:50S ribosomal protein L34, chloroplastic-like n=1 Tax=Melia azedarach TaxID=155640 RepID=A0ACC1WWS6_MELAZ|nr:50S ribosomal protein L34, chloroplastic-like [Melia azedarach]